MPDSDAPPPGFDPLRVLRLLWEPPPAGGRGRKPRLALDEVVAAGMRVADARGIEALSMRHVAAELKAGAMTLYTYVAGKAELVELMVDRAYGEHRLPEPTRPPRERVAFLARESWDLFHRHPWMLQTNLWRFSFGPNAMDVAEAHLAALEAWGVAVQEVADTLRTVEAFVQGAARSAITDRQTSELTGESLDTFYSSRQGFWETYFDAARYPAHARIWEQGGFDQEDDSFRFGLDRLLDAIETRLPRPGS